MANMELESRMKEGYDKKSQYYVIKNRPFQTFLDYLKRLEV